MGKKKGNKKNGLVKLGPAVRSDIALLVDKLIKKCSKVGSQTVMSPKQECEEFQEIYSIVEQIRVLEKDIRLPSYDRKESLKEFQDWSKEKGIKASGVEAQDYGNEGYGLRTASALTTGQPVIEVPVSSMMKQDDATATYIGSLISRDPLLQDMGNVRLALFLLLEYLNPDSKWGPYVRSLPQDFTHMPLYCTPQHLARLKQSPALSALVKQYRNICRQYAYFYRIFYSMPEARNWPLKEFFTYDAYRWAVCCVSSRANLIPSEGNKGQLALVPYWDLVNHRTADKITTDFSPEQQMLICYAAQDYAVDEQFTMHYGNRSIIDFFLHSGFVPKVNGSAVIKLGLSKTDPNYDAKCEVLGFCGLDSPVCELPLQESSSGLSAAHLFAMVFQADSAQCQDIQAAVLKAEGSPSDEPSKQLYTFITEAAPELSKSAKGFLRDRLNLLVKLYDAVLKGTGDGQSALDDLITALLQSEHSVYSSVLQQL